MVADASGHVPWFRRASPAVRALLATVRRMEPEQHDVTAAARPAVRGPAGAAAGRRGRGRVRAIARAAGRTCSRPSCETPAAATLVFSYAEQVARLVDLLDEREPQTYDLCPPHADRTRPPVGWELSDTRPPPSDAPRRLEDDETVEVLAAALRGETPKTRVHVVPGGQEGEDDEPADPAPAVTDPDADEDPLRAALEELQRIAAPDDDPARLAAPATPLRRAATPTPPPPSELPDPIGPPPPPPSPSGTEPGEPTLW